MIYKYNYNRTDKSGFFFLSTHPINLNKIQTVNLSKVLILTYYPSYLCHSSLKYSPKFLQNSYVVLSNTSYATYKWQLLSCSVTTCQFQNHLSYITENFQLSEICFLNCFFTKTTNFIYASSISVADHFIIYIQVLETYPTKPRNLALQDSCQTILTYNPIHSNESMNSTNLSNRKNLVAITDERHRRKERCLAFKKVKEEGICNLKRELSVCIMQNLEFVNMGFDQEKDSSLHTTDRNRQKFITGLNKVHYGPLNKDRFKNTFNHWRLLTRMVATLGAISEAQWMCCLYIYKGCDIKCCIYCFTFDSECCIQRWKELLHQNYPTIFNVHFNPSKWHTNRTNTTCAFTMNTGIIWKSVFLKHR